MRVFGVTTMTLLLGATFAVGSAAEEGGAGEADGWLAVTGPPGCAPSAEDLAARIERTHAGQWSPTDRTVVTIEGRAGEYRVSLRMKGARKVLAAPTCDEATDAAVAVLSLAFSTLLQDAAMEGGTSVSEPVPAPPPAPTRREATRSATEGVAAAPEQRPAAIRVDATADAPLSAPARRSPEGVRVSLSAGVDHGTLPATTALGGLGVARTFGPVALRGVLRYGLPVEDERIDPGQVERARHEFAAGEVGACYAEGGSLRIAACGGAELGLVRSARVLVHDAGRDESSATSPRLAGVLAANLSHPTGLIQPEIELSGFAVVAGLQGEAARTGLRASVGASVQF